MHRTTRLDELEHLIPRTTRSVHAAPARWLAVSVTTAAVLLAVLGCASTSTVLAPIAPIGTPRSAINADAQHTISTHEVAQTAGPLTRGPLVATCPPGELALSGGWSIPTTARVYAAKLTGNSWAISVQTLPPTNSAGEPVATPTSGQQASTPITAYVECLRGSSGITLTQRATTISVPPSVPDNLTNSTSYFEGHCQTAQGESPVGFGFDLGAANAFRLGLEETAPVEGDGPADTYWWFRVWNHDSMAHDATIYVQCATFPIGNDMVTYSVLGSDARLSAGMSGSAVASCPTGALLGGGGFTFAFAGTGAAFTDNAYSQHATPSGWESDRYVFASNGPEAIPFGAVAVCLSLA